MKYKVINKFITNENNNNKINIYKFVSFKN